MILRIFSLSLSSQRIYLNIHELNEFTILNDTFPDNFIYLVYVETKYGKKKRSSEIK